MTNSGRVKAILGWCALSASAALMGSPIACADGGYLVLSGGVARTDVVTSQGAGIDTQKTYRLAAGMDVNPAVAVEVGVGTAGPYTPAASVLTQTPGAQVKITTIDLSLLTRYAPTDRVRLFAALGPALASVRTELPVGRGSTTLLTSGKKWTWRAALGLDVAVSDHIAIQLSAWRLGGIPIGGGVDWTGRHPADGLTAGVLVQF